MNIVILKNPGEPVGEHAQYVTFAWMSSITHYIAVEKDEVRLKVGSGNRRPSVQFRQLALSL